MQEAKYQNRPTTPTSKWDLSWILNVCVEGFDREVSPCGGFAKLLEERSVAVDSNDRNAGCSGGERVASAPARDVEDHAQLGRGPNPLELVTEEVGGRRPLRHRLSGHFANRQ
jgi:hypothetical protein